MELKNLILMMAFIGLVSRVWATSGELSIGASYDGWSTNYVAPGQDYGYEAFVPVNLSYDFGDLSFYAQGQFGNGCYINSTNGDYNLTNFSDTVVGGRYSFRSFGLKSIVEISGNLPTGDTSWETKAEYSEPPVNFITDRFEGRGLGFSGFYGLSLPDGRGEYSLGAGYLYSGAFNPNFGISSNTKLGDAVFGAINRVTPISNNENEIMRFSVYETFPTYENGQNVYQLGTNFNLAYNWVNPKALSFEVGGQVYLPSSYYGVTESHNSNGPRVYGTATYAFDDLTLTGRVKYIFQNDYPINDASGLQASNDGGGGLQLGFEPAYRFHMTDSSFLKVSASLDDLWANNDGTSSTGSYTTVNFLFWAVNTEYTWKL